jgi:hypothetical protein
MLLLAQPGFWSRSSAWVRSALASISVMPTMRLPFLSSLLTYLYGLRGKYMANLP